jgi:hypothetical protein
MARLSHLPSRFVPRLESLEDRTLPAPLVPAWPDASRLTLSFPADGTPIVDIPSNLFATLDAVGPRDWWQGEVVRAFQTWAALANVNVGVVADDGEAFGTAGRVQGDSRFGDIRIGAHAMSSDALAVTVLPDAALAGTWSGDVFLNSSATFTSDNLFPVLLHEAAHAFGLGDSTDPHSPRYPQLNLQNVTPTADDIADLQALYGQRTSASNHTRNTATQLNYAGMEVAGVAPLVGFGDVTGRGDVHYFSVPIPSNYTDPVTFQLQTSGLSLLAPRLTVEDASGRQLGEADSTSVQGDTVTVHFDHVTRGAVYYARVEGDVAGAFGAGRYALTVTLDSNVVVDPAWTDTIVRGPYTQLPQREITRLLLNPDARFRDTHTPETFGSAVQLRSSPGYAVNSHYETLSNLVNGTDEDLYRITAPNGSGTTWVLNVTLTVLPDEAVPQVSVYDNNQHLVSDVLVNGNGTFTVQVAQAQPGAHYFLHVGAGRAGNAAGGNYLLIAHFGGPVANLQTFATGTLDAPGGQNAWTLYVGENQLFHFALTATSTDLAPGTAVQMTLTDSAGNVQFTLVAPAGETVSASGVFLKPGAYTVQFTAVSDGSTPATLNYTLRGNAISDPIGPVADDPTYQPMYRSPDDPTLFLYPDGTTTSDPFHWLQLF